jgi:predicted transcriptional regulator
LNPVTGDQGRYRITNGNSDLPDHCSEWNSGFIVHEVIDQWTPKDDVVVISEIESEPADNIVELIIPTTAVVVSTSLLSLCLVFILNTEWIRIAALNGGLALIGMVRRRDYDGEFQRGRVVGYLVANPGVHFRALLGALNMSNGQLAHHLKVLEDQELLWRRRDGRMMRYYPSTVDQLLDGENLPVPLLTPDPNSLQGRILNLLDATGNDIVNLSQKELSDRLESSQQLISHHLKTLEGYGLIERDKVGLRYRYRLTREAIFLLESTDFLQDR